MIRRVKEGEITWFANLRSSDIPYPLPRGITVHLRRDEVGLEVQGLVGAIPMRNGDTLQIIPKIGQVNFLRLLFKAEGAQRDLQQEYDKFVSYSLDDEENINTIVARQLIYAAAEIMKRSPLQGRVRRQHVGRFAAGQVDAVATALNIAQRKQEPVSYVIKEKTLDIPENRVLTEAIVRAWRLLDDANKDYLVLIKDRWLRRYPGSSDLGGDLEYIEQAFAAGRFGGSRDYYRRALMLAQIILGSSGLGFRESAMFEGDAILLSTADVFEKYLRSIIGAEYAPSGYIVTKGGVGATSLYTDGSFELHPDIIIARDGRTLLIADAKYKEPTAGDHYQMYTYLASNKIKRGLLLAPLYHGDEVVLREYATSDNTIVREAYLPMRNLDVTEAFLKTVLTLAS